MNSLRVAGPKVFLAATFGPFVRDGVFLPARKAEILEYYTRLTELGASVFSSHVNEDWGAAGLPPEDCMRDDLRALHAADSLCALLGDQPSAGVAFELGYAASVRRPTVLVTSSFRSQSSMIRGMGSLLELKVVEGDPGSRTVVEKACAASIDLGVAYRKSDRFWESSEVGHALKFRTFGGAR
ncbi:nucleoside 2-deoxyribosyltransferase [Pseudonocardia sp. ICBG162]|uniref:nucleoside 2-deoxyribosyltransferase n=1 Tax=Pseudonocardia sp. ICBG162 TaxID=2846761 RepID=UPI001CF617C0|nr:nucleoside 2-deoxyribosyltransferase [Pseudonocardia sp. ICBG162]